MACAAGGCYPPPRDGCEGVRFRRRGGRPRPPADMEEGWSNGLPGASAPTGWCIKRAWCGNRGRDKPLPYGDGRRLAGVQHGTSGTPSPTARNPGFAVGAIHESPAAHEAGNRQREGQAPPLRGWGCLGAERAAGRRGRRPLRALIEHGRVTAGG